MIRVCEHFAGEYFKWSCGQRSSGSSSRCRAKDEGGGGGCQMPKLIYLYFGRLNVGNSLEVNLKRHSQTSGEMQIFVRGRGG